MRVGSFWFGVVILLGCTGLLGEPTPATDSGDDDDGGGSTLEQPEICAEYLDCLDALGEDDGEADTFGPSGTCWEGDEDEAEDCEDECDRELEDLAAENPFEPDCGGLDRDDVEGTWVFGASDGQDCQGTLLAITSVVWDVSVVGDGLAGTATVVLEADGSESLETELDFDCTLEPPDFQCPLTQVDGYVLEYGMDGEVDGDRMPVDFTVQVYEGECVLVFELEGERD